MALIRDARGATILVDFMGPAFWVPALLVTHYLAFLVLRRPGVPG